MSKKDSGGGKSKRKNNGPAELRYTAEMRWERNKRRSHARGQRERDKHAAKHARRGTLGYRDRQIARATLYQVI